MSTADCLDAFADERDTETAYREAVRQLNVLGFNPHTDAISSQTAEPSIYYFHDGEIRFTGKSRHGDNEWLSPSSIHTPGSLHETLTAVGDFTVIDKRVFNWLTSGPLADADTVHGGLCWAIVQRYGHRIEEGGVPTARELQVIDGIDGELAREVVRRFNEYPTYPDSLAELSP